MTVENQRSQVCCPKPDPTNKSGCTVARVSNLLGSLGHTGRRRVVLGHTLNTQTVMKTDEQKKKKVLNEFTILCWAAFIASVGYVMDTLMLQ